MTTSVVLLGLSHSVYTRIARLTLEEKCVPYQLEEVDIFGNAGVPASHLKRHPFGRVPVLLHGSTSIYETAAICRYVDEAFAGPRLQPNEPVARARVAQIIGLLDSYAYRPMVWGVFVQRVDIPSSGGVADDAQVAASLKASRIALGALAELCGDSPFLVGGSLSLADLHAYPMLRYLCLVPEGRAEIRRFRNITEWMRRLDARESVQRTRSSYEGPRAGT